MAMIKITKVPSCIEVPRSSRTFSVPVTVTYSFTGDEFRQSAGECSGVAKIVLFAGGPSGAKSPKATTIPVVVGSGTESGAVTVEIPSSWYVGKHSVTIYAKLRFPYENKEYGTCDERDVASDSATVTVAWGTSCEGETPPTPTPEQPVCKPTLCSSGDRRIAFPVEYRGEQLLVDAGKVNLKLCVSPSCVKPGQQYKVSATITVTGSKLYPNVKAINATLSGPFGKRSLTFKNGETKTLTFTAPATEKKYVLHLAGVVTLGASEVPPELPEKVSGNFWINVPMWVVSDGGTTPENPITNWTVEVPPSVKPGQTFKVVVKAYASKPTQVKATGTLFGKTVTKGGQAPGGSTPAMLELTFTAPTQPGTYQGSVKLDAYY